MNLFRIKKRLGVTVFVLSILFTIFGSLFVSFSPVFDTCNKVHAQNFKRLEIPKPTTLPGPTGVKQNKTYLRDVLIVSISRTLISLVGGIALLFFIIGGVRMLTSYGDEGGITSGKKTLIYSVVGFLLAIFSYAIVSIIGNIQLDAPTQQHSQTQSSDSGSTKTNSK